MRLLNCIKYWLGIRPAWERCVHASCWSGRNASKRMMNMLSPAMPEKVFRERVAWMLKRGCDTVHWFVANKGDGEYAGYCIYGTDWDWEVDKPTVKLFRSRIAYARKRGLGVVLWLNAE